MLLSMTGYGEARSKLDGLAVGVEVRTINSRYFKLAIECLEGYDSLEAEIEQRGRGSIQPRVRSQLYVARRPAARADDAASTRTVLDGYRAAARSYFTRVESRRASPYRASAGAAGRGATSTVLHADGIGRGLAALSKSHARSGAGATWRHMRREEGAGDGRRPGGQLPRRSRRS